MIRNNHKKNEKHFENVKFLTRRCPAPCFRASPSHQVFSMLYTIVFIACLTEFPQSCSAYEQPVHGFASHPAAAFVQAQGVLAQWLNAHPGYTLRRWKLQPGLGA